MIHRQNLKWIVEKEIQSWRVFLACTTKFLLTFFQFPIFLSHQKSKFPISFPIWMPFASLIESSSLNQERKKKKILHLDWKFGDLCYLLGVTLISIFEEISGTQANYIAISIIQVYCRFFLISFVFPVVFLLKLMLLIFFLSFL